MQVINDACALGNNNTVDEAKRQPAADRIAQELRDVSQGGNQLNLGFRGPAVQPSLDSAAKAGPSKICEQCAKPFEPRSRSGGKPQRFCSPPCRAAYHASERQRGQRSPTLDAQSTLPAVIQPEPEPAPAATDEGYCWAVPQQARIECWLTNDDQVEIEEINEADETESVRICVTRGNAVRLARSILSAAGFKSVSIATVVKGGYCYCDVEDGDLPEQFYDVAQ